MAIKVDHNEIPETTLETKRWWRKKVKEAQSELSDEYMQIASDAIRHKLIRMDEYHQAKTVLLYVNTGKEVITRTLMSVANKHDKTVALPLCVDTEAHLMEARLWNSEYKLAVGAYGIPEPDPDSPVVKPEDIDLVVLPCVSCDSECNRLGHGAGYYDRFMEGLREDCFKVALCYEKIMAEEIPTEPHDRPVDAVITEENIYGK